MAINDRFSPYEALIEAIQTIEDFVINARLEDIKFTVAEDEGHPLPIVDVTVTGPGDVDVFSDLNFDSFEEAIIALAKGLTQ